MDEKEYWKRERPIFGESLPQIKCSWPLCRCNLRASYKVIRLGQTLYLCDAHWRTYRGATGVRLRKIGYDEPQLPITSRLSTKSVPGASRKWLGTSSIDHGGDIGLFHLLSELRRMGYETVEET